MPVMCLDHAMRRGVGDGGGRGVLRIKWSQHWNLIRHLPLSVDEQVVMIDGLAAGNNSLGAGTRPCRARTLLTQQQATTMAAQKINKQTNE